MSPTATTPVEVTTPPAEPPAEPPAVDPPAVDPPAVDVAPAVAPEPPAEPPAVDFLPPYHAPIRRADYPRGIADASILPRPDSYQRRHSFSGTTWAIDLAVSVGSPVYAHASGVVSRVSDLADPYNGIGVWLAADSGPLAGVAVAAIHLSHRLVEKDQRVNRGDLIGYSGNTGKSEGPHIHWEVGAMVDPLDPTLFGWAGAGWVL